MSARGTGPIAVRDLELDPDDELVARLHREVLSPSFSPDELSGPEELALGLRGHGDADVLASVALGADGALLGGVVGEVFASERVLLLAYLAVRPDRRGRGIGTVLMEHVAPRWYARPEVQLVLAEVHDPRRWSGREHEDPVGRLRLFERLGAQVLGVPFVQPAVGPGRARVPGFLLLAFHVDPGAEVEHDGERAVRSDFVAAFVRRYYEATEGVLDPADSQLSALLAQIVERPAVPLLPIAEYRRVPLLA